MVAPRTRPAANRCARVRLPPAPSRETGGQVSLLHGRVRAARPGGGSDHRTQRSPQGKGRGMLTQQTRALPAEASTSLLLQIGAGCFLLGVVLVVVTEV